MNQSDFRTVNPMLGIQPSIGPIPADQIIPWSVILGASYLVGQGIFSFGLLWTFLLAAWGMSTWWVVTGGRSWRFLANFQSTPHWTRGCARYQPLIRK